MMYQGDTVNTVSNRCSRCASSPGPTPLARETLDYGRPRPHTASAGPIPLGRTLADNFRLRQVLGQGCTGIVYLAEDFALEREVAIKVLLPGYAADPRVARSFRREAVAMASVRHENVVQVHAFGEYEGLPYFVMEYLPRGSVAALLEQATLAGEQLYLDVVLGVLSQVSRGLQALHERRVVHNDVKPANMLIGPPFRVALADFGLVQLADTTAASADLAGTPMYLAPELILGRHIPEDQRHLGDIYALAVSAFELLTGASPYACGSISELLSHHLEDEPLRVSELRPDLPAAFDGILQRAMAKEPGERHASAPELVAALMDARIKSSQAGRTRAGRRILVVEQDPGQRSRYTSALVAGIPDALIMTAEDGVSALDLVRAARPDLVLLDLELPQLNGVEVAACIGGDVETADIPIVVLAGESTASLLEGLGVQQVLEKPVDPARLVEGAQSCLRPSSRRAQASTSSQGI
jgi:serine/threonine-protein kinase